MKTARSKDGTLIAFDRVGDGRPILLVDGALCYRASGPMGPLAALLAQHFTVFTKAKAMAPVLTVFFSER